MSSGDLCKPIDMSFGLLKVAYEEISNMEAINLFGSESLAILEPG